MAESMTVSEEDALLEQLRYWVEHGYNPHPDKKIALSRKDVRVLLERIDRED